MTVMLETVKQADLRLCRLCFTNKFADGIGRVCVDCKRRVCNECGSFNRRTVGDHEKAKVRYLLRVLVTNRTPHTLVPREIINTKLRIKVNATAKEKITIFNVLRCIIGPVHY